MEDKLTTHTALRSGSKVIYVGEPGEMIALVPSGKFAIVAHPERPPKRVNFDGSVEPFDFGPVVTTDAG